MNAPQGAPRAILSVVGGVLGFFAFMFLIAEGSLYYDQLQVERQNAERAQQEAQRAEQEAQRIEATARDREHYLANKATLVPQIERLVKDGKYTQAMAALDRYAPFETGLEQQKLLALRREAELQYQRHRFASEELTNEQKVALFDRLAVLEPADSKAQKVALDMKRLFERLILIEKQLSTWTGSHHYVEQAVKRSMHNPKSYEHVHTTYADTKDGIIIETTFRGTNGFGAVVTNKMRAVVDINGHVLSLRAVRG